MNILGTNRSEMADPHPRDSARPNVGHTSRRDPRGIDRLLRADYVIREMSSALRRDVSDEKALLDVHPIATLSLILPNPDSRSPHRPIIRISQRE